MKKPTSDGWLYLALGLGALLLTIEGTVVYNMTRGLRNNNPGNLRKDNTAWDGLASVQSDPAFFVFKSPFYGLRALARTLYNYHARHGRNTIAQYIAAYAPSNENDTLKYIDFVCKKVGKRSTDPLNFPGDLIHMAHAIVRYENGVDPYDGSTWNASLNSGLYLS